MAIQVLSPETGNPVYTLDPGITVFRWEPADAPTPMSPHSSPYAPYGRWEFGYKHLFLVEERALTDLTGLREGQGYFTENVILRHAQLHTLMSQNPGAVLLEDLKFNFTVLGGNRKGGLIIAAP